MNQIPELYYASFHLEKRFKWSPMARIIDMADYPYGYIFDVPGFKLLKFKVSKVMEKEDYIMVMSVFGYEFVIR
jgi:hypothetical protein